MNTANPMFRTAALAGAVFVLAACAAQPGYLPPTDGQSTAEVTVNVHYSSRNFFEGFSVRGAVKCNPVPGIRLLDPVTEEPARAVVVAQHQNQSLVTRLPANVPVPLRFTYLRVNEVLVWDFVVVLEAGRSYETSLDTKTGPRFVDKLTQAEALRMPHNWFRAGLECS